MSGHSKWSKIKRQKGVKDQKRGALFTKLGKNITLAAKEGGVDIDTNFSLRLAVDKAKQANMPSDNIDRAIKKGSGNDSDGVEIQRISYEAFGIGGVSIIIDCQTDNKNRTVAEVKRTVENCGGKFASVGSIIWKFDEKGVITLTSEKIVQATKFGQEETFEKVDIDELQMVLMDIPGIIDLKIDNNDEGEQVVEVFTAKSEFASVLKSIYELKYRVLSAELAKLPKELITITPELQERNDRLIEMIEENEDVESVWADY